MNIKAFFDDIDMSKKYPNYFNKPLIQFSFIICLILISLAFVFNGYSLQYFYSECQDINGCINPLYICNDLHCMKTEACDKYGCTSQYMQYKETIGKENKFIQYVNGICLIIVTIAFIFNHIEYRRKYGKNNNNK